VRDVDLPFSYLYFFFLDFPKELLFENSVETLSNFAVSLLFLGFLYHCRRSFLPCDDLFAAVHARRKISAVALVQ
jgi:hypothetical protein